MTASEMAAWVAETRAAQDLPATIDNPATLAELAGMVAEMLPLAEGGERLDKPA
jgi:hypothetical protein